MTNSRGRRVRQERRVEDGRGPTIGVEEGVGSGRVMAQPDLPKFCFISDISSAFICIHFPLFFHDLHLKIARKENAPRFPFDYFFVVVWC